MAQRRVLAFGLILLFLVSPVFAGGGQEDDGTVVLEYWTQAQPAHAAMVEAFEASHPGITIEQTDMPADEQRQVMTSALGSGTGPDVFYFELGLGHIEPMINANLIVPLDEHAERFAWKERLTDFARAEATHQGGLRAIPNEAEFIAMWYNKQIFTQLGYQVPTTWDEFVEIAEAAEEAGYNAVSFGMVAKWPALHRVSLGFQWNPEGKSAVADAAFEEEPFDTSDFVSGFERLMMLDGVYMDDALGMTHEEAIAEFLSGNSAMFHMGTWLIEDVLASENPENFGIFIMPKPGSSELDTVAGAGGGWYINSDTEHLEEALQFLNFTISDESMEIWVQNGYVPPVPFDVSQVSGVPPLLIEIVDTLNRNQENMGYFIHHFVSARQNEWIQDGYQALLAGDADPEGFVERFEDLAVEARLDGFRP